MPTTSTEHGFERIDERDIPELNTRAVLYRHAATGAELLSLSNDDENKVFGITFKTVPEDSTGIAHILEHSVLCGSEKYPVKEPFVELLKGSLKTFLNAMTFPDKTCYPVASPNAQDLYNLMDVYLDAVFHPRLTPMTLRQEGWHFHQESPDGPLTIQGVVYNEMKGVYSSPDALLGEALQQALFPDTPYGLDSGGDPRHIPDLTWEAFADFHRRNYHPSNARIFMAGDDDPAERLRRLDAGLTRFEAAPAGGELPLQAPFESPRRLRQPFCAEAGGPGADRGLAALCWALPDPLDPRRLLTFEALAHLLLGTSAAPLRKALIDSGLGEGLAGAGLETQLRQMYLAAGLRGIRPSDAPRMEAQIVETLEGLVARGLDRDLIEASLNTIEFLLRENNTGSFPRGLAQMLTVLPAWLHGADPIAPLAFEAPLEALRRDAAEPGFFEDLIARHLLRNPHAAALTLEPDPGMAERLQAAEQARIAEACVAMSPEERARVVADTRTLQAAQDRPDAPEDLARIPSLTVEDLDRENRRIPQAVEDADPAFFLHPLPTRGIVYLDLGFDLRGVPPRLLPLVPIFARALLETGTRREDFVALSRRIGRETGGVRAAPVTLSRLDDARASPWLFVEGKALAPRAEALLGILRDVLHEARIDDGARIRQLLLEAKAAAESALVQGGSAFVARRIAARLEESAWFEERMRGIEALFAVRALAARAETDAASVQADFEALRAALLRRAGALAALTAEEAALPGLRAGVAALAGTLEERSAEPTAWTPESAAGHEALTLPAQVNYVGLGANLFAAGYADHGAALIATRLITTGWLWDRVRVRGGAYGVSCRFAPATGICTFTSYRDPRVAETLEAFRGAPAWLREAAGDDALRRRAIIGTIGEMDAPLLPDAKGRLATRRRLTGNDEARRDRVRAEVLGADAADLRRFADALEAALRHGLVAALGSPEALRGLEDSAGGPVRETPVLRGSAPSES